MKNEAGWCCVLFMLKGGEKIIDDTNLMFCDLTITK